MSHLQFCPPIMENTHRRWWEASGGDMERESGRWQWSPGQDESLEVLLGMPYYCIKCKLSHEKGSRLNSLTIRLYDKVVHGRPFGQPPLPYFHTPTRDAAPPKPSTVPQCVAAEPTWRRGGRAEAPQKKGPEFAKSKTVCS